MKPHPSMEHFCRVLMGEWIKIDYEMDLLESDVSKEKLKFKANSTETNRQDSILNVAMTVNNFHTIVAYLNAMAVASKK